MYEQLLKYLTGGEGAMEGLSRNRRKYLRQAAKSHIVPKAHEPQYLRYIESTGAQSICLTEAEIPRYLYAAHEDHRHHAAWLTLDYLVGRAY